MLVRKEQRIEKQAAKLGTIWEYHLPTKAMRFAFSKYDGRIPDSGWVRNRVCNEMYYVISGSGTIFVEDKRYELKEGDVFLVEPGKKFYLVAKNMRLAISTSPAWYEEQYEVLSD